MTEKPAHSEKPLLIAIGGLSGSGKTSLARALQKVIPDAIHLDSDRTRKEIFGVPVEARLPPEAYSLEATQRVIDETARRVRAHIAAGQNVIISAVFLPPQSRADEEKLARECGAAFVGLWLQAEVGVLVDRVKVRVNDASDATVDIVNMQAAEGAGVVAWRVINAALSREDVLAAALKILKEPRMDANERE
jgi:predicted kinase